MSKFLNLLAESIPSSVVKTIGNKDSDSQTKSAELNWNPELDDTQRGQGSSRHYWEMPEKHHITLDGKPASIKHGIKLAVKSDLDDYHTGKMFGKQQNIEESKPEYNDFRVIKKTGDTYETNHSGVLTPIFHSEHDGSWVDVGHVTPLKKDKTGFCDAIDKLTPKNFSGRKPDIDDILIAVKDKEHLNQDPKYVMSSYNKRLLDEHPFAKKLASLVTHTGITSHDLHSENFGIFEHPHTKEKIPVVLDYGANKTLLSNYQTARETSSKVRNLKETNNIN